MRMLVTVMLAAATICACSSTEPGPSPSPSPSTVIPPAPVDTSTSTPSAELDPKFVNVVTQPPHRPVEVPTEKIETRLQAKPPAICGDAVCAADEYCCNDTCSKQPCP